MNTCFKYTEVNNKQIFPCYQVNKSNDSTKNSNLNINITQEKSKNDKQDKIKFGKGQVLFSKKLEHIKNNLQLYHKKQKKLKNENEKFEKEKKNKMTNMLTVFKIPPNLLTIEDVVDKYKKKCISYRSIKDNKCEKQKEEYLKRIEKLIDQKEEERTIKFDFEERKDNKINYLLKIKGEVEKNTISMTTNLQTISSLNNRKEYNKNINRNKSKIFNSKENSDFENIYPVNKRSNNDMYKNRYDLNSFNRGSVFSLKRNTPLLNEVINKSLYTRNKKEKNEVIEDEIVNRTKEEKIVELKLKETKEEKTNDNILTINTESYDINTIYKKKNYLNINSEISSAFENISLNSDVVNSFELNINSLEKINKKNKLLNHITTNNTFKNMNEYKHMNSYISDNKANSPKYISNSINDINEFFYYKYKNTLNNLMKLKNHKEKNLIFSNKQIEEMVEFRKKNMIDKLKNEYNIKVKFICGKIKKFKKRISLYKDVLTSPSRYRNEKKNFVKKKKDNNNSKYENNENEEEIYNIYGSFMKKGYLENKGSNSLARKKIILGLIKLEK